MVYLRAAATALLSGIIMPLYIYPGDGCAAWQPLSTAISAHPDLPFYVIINPASGPGDDPTPDTTYQACIPTLWSAFNPNVKVLGYVATGYGDKDPDDITGEVDVYAAWPTTYRPDGIFFDEADLPNSASGLMQWTNLYDHVGAKNWHESGGSFVVLNPGVSASNPDYFDIADLIVTFENYYANFNVEDLIIDASHPGAKQAIILHDGPSSPPTDDIDATVTQDHLGAVYFTDILFTHTFGPYAAFPSEWDDFVDEVEAAANA